MKLKWAMLAILLGALSSHAIPPYMFTNSNIRLGPYWKVDTKMSLALWCEIVNTNWAIGSTSVVTIAEWSSGNLDNTNTIDHALQANTSLSASNSADLFLRFAGSYLTLSSSGPTSTVVSPLPLDFSTGAGSLTHNTYPIITEQTFSPAAQSLTNASLQSQISTNLSLQEVVNSDVSSNIVTRVRTNHLGNTSIAGTQTVTNLKLSSSVWDNITISALQLGTVPATPNIQDYGTNGAKGLAFNSGDYIYGDTQLPHRYKRGTSILPNASWSTSTNSSTTNVVFKLSLTYGSVGGLLVNYYTDTVTNSGNAAFVQDMVTFASLPGNALEESTLIMFKLEVVSDFGIADSIFIHDVGYHYEVNKLGSSSLPPTGD